MTPSILQAVFFLQLALSDFCSDLPVSHNQLPCPVGNADIGCTFPEMTLAEVFTKNNRFYIYSRLMKVSHCDVTVTGFTVGYTGACRVSLTVWSLKGGKRDIVNFSRMYDLKSTTKGELLRTPRTVEKPILLRARGEIYFGLQVQNRGSENTLKCGINFKTARDTHCKAVYGNVSNLPYTHKDLDESTWSEEKNSLLDFSVQVQDVDECQLSEYRSACGRQNLICKNIPGSYQCTCERGYNVSNQSQCADIDECTKWPSVCGQGETCQNTEGSFRCSCKPGFTGYGCTDVYNPNCNSTSDSSANAECSPAAPPTGHVFQSTIQTTNESSATSTSPENQTSFDREQTANIARTTTLTALPLSLSVHSRRSVLFGSEMTADESSPPEPVSTIVHETNNPTSGVTSSGNERKPASGKDSSSQIAVLIIVAILLAAILLVIFSLFLWRRKRLCTPTVPVMSQFSSRRQHRQTCTPLQSMYFDDQGAVQQMTRQWGEENGQDISHYSKPHMDSMKLAVAVEVNVTCEEYDEPVTAAHNRNSEGSEMQLAAESDIKQVYSELSEVNMSLNHTGTSHSVVPFETDEGATAYHHLTYQVRQSQTYEEPPTRIDELYSHLQRKAILHLKASEVQLKKSIGSGEFGLVYKGVLKQGKNVPVAVKVFHDDGAGNSQEARQSLLQEVAILHQFHHPNVLKLLGIVDNPMMLVTELLEKGDLLGYLRSFQPPAGRFADDNLPQQLLRMCQEISSGMFYLSSLGFVHRDIAARNILLDHKLTCKICDFGMSRQLSMANYYRSSGGKIPVRWTAPEALLYQKYTTSTDVWSFGVTLYEIWTLGKLPFPGMDNAEVITIVTDQRQRLPPPPGCSRGIYQIMIDCWHPEPNGRLSFKVINRKLNTNARQLLKLEKKDGVLGGTATAFENRFDDLRDKYC